MKEKPIFLVIAFILFLNVAGKSQDYARHLELSLLFYEAERAGKLPEDNRIYWRHDSLLDAGKDVGLDLVGGYHDAGDNVIFNFPGASAMTLLAWSGIEFEDAYKKTGQWKYLLNTVKWETDYFIKCNPEPDVLYCGIGKGNIDHEFWYPPEYINYETPALKLDKDNPGSEVSGETAAALAATSILFKEDDPQYSQTCLKHAQEIYKFGTTYQGTYTLAEGFYGGGEYKDELAWGAAWLYRATGEEKYMKEFEKYADQFLGFRGPIGWGDKSPGYYILIAQITGEEKYLSRAYEYCDAIVGDSKTPGGLYYTGYSNWGSNRVAANAAAMPAMFANFLPESDPKRKEYINFVQKQINYILGDNPLGVNYVVGAEENSPKAVHHRAASGSYDYESNFPPENVFTIYGALAGGPTGNDEWEDIRSDYVKNEIALDYNAGFTLDLAALVHFGLGEKDFGEILNFDRAWPPKPPTPDITIEMDKSSLSISTDSGMKCSAWCVSFNSDEEISLGQDSVLVKDERYDYTICNHYKNNYLDGKGTAQKVEIKTKGNFKTPEEFEVLCDGYNAHQGKKEPAYKPEWGHSYKITGNGGKENTKALYEKTKCWPSFVCE